MTNMASVLSARWMATGEQEAEEGGLFAVNGRPCPVDSLIESKSRLCPTRKYVFNFIVYSAPQELNKEIYERKLNFRIV